VLPGAGPVRRYLAETRDPLYAALLVLPLVLGYSLGAWALDWTSLNGVDFATPLLLEFFGLTGYLYFNLGLVAVAVGVAVWLRVQRGHLRLELLAPMVLESVVYAVLMGIVILFVLKSATPFLAALAEALKPSAAAGAYGDLAPLEKLTLSAGAGFYEELVFRLVLLGGTRWLMVRTLGLGPVAGWVFAVLGTSIVFSLVHYLGDESFELYSFFFRTLAGLYFATIYAVRGFAVAAWTHAIYDVIVMFGG
jgi:membrane protease YdiL (CAAX protease family)